MTQTKPSGWPLALCALGVVYGDIGTSPLYALRECLAQGGFDPNREITVLGPISLIVWSLTIIVGLKYLLLLTKADNQGEGGTFALYALLRRKRAGLSKRAVRSLAILALMGASLLYGDGIITPAISVLAAVEGLKEVHACFSAEWIVPWISAAILLAMFLFQQRRKGRAGVRFGPVMLLWFITLAILGLIHLWHKPHVLLALLPHYGWVYLFQEQWHAIQIMGTVLLAVTGCEALYADIGHFGRSAMNRSWFYIAYPALLLNYLGQGALLLSDASAWHEPFFKMVPQGWLIPVVGLGMVAAVIASQAMITGVFSLTQQALQLGFMPRLKVIHTDKAEKGEVFLPFINALLCVACISVVFGFRSSGNLAHAYGLSVSSNMLLTTVLMFLLTTHVWQWARWKALLVCGLFLSMEVAYVAGGLAKLQDGAWFTLLVAFGSLLIMKTWRDGRKILIKRVVRSLVPESQLVDELTRNSILRVPGIGVFLTSSADGVPLVLLHHLKHNKMLHKTAVILNVRFEEEPFIPEDRRTKVVDIYGSNFLRIILHYGFAESPEVLRDLCVALKERGVVKVNDISFYQSRELLTTSGNGRMAQWRKRFFIFLSRIARPANGYFQLPSRQVIELGIQLEL